MAAVVESVWTRLQNSGNKASKERWRTQRRVELMKESMGADRRGRIGMMCETPYLSIGDDYMDSSVRETQGSRVGAYTFRANSQHLDQTFTEQLELDDRTLPNCIGDPYVDDKRMRRGQRRRGRPRTAPAGRGGKGKKGDEAPPPPPPEEPADDDDAPAWRPNGGPQSNRPNPYLALVDQDTDEAVVRELVKEGKKKTVMRRPKTAGGEEAEPLKNFLTNPVKKGTYGFPGVTLGEKMHSSIYQYVSAPDAGATLAETRKAMRQRGADDDAPPPWRPNQREKTTKWDACFDRNQPGRFKRFGRAPPTAAERHRDRGKKTEVEQAEDELPAWRPSNHLKTTKWDACIEKFTPHMPEPEPARQVCFVCFVFQPHPRLRVFVANELTRSSPTPHSPLLTPRPLLAHPSPTPLPLPPLS